MQTLTTNNGGPGYPQFLTFQQTYSYDGVNRLRAMTDSGGAARNFAYDQYGNMAVQASSGVPWSGLTPYAPDSNAAALFDSSNRLKTGGFDAAGNQTTVGSIVITYDADNRQTQTQDGNYPAVTYTYDGNGQRVMRSAANGVLTVFVYDAFGHLAAEYSNTPTTAPPCSTCYLSYDHLGTPRLVTDQNGNVVARHDYLPFGEEVSAGTAGRASEFGAYDAVRQKFTGQERDDTGLDFFQARYFSGAQGRFTSPDPANAGAICTIRKAGMRIAMSRITP